MDGDPVGRAVETAVCHEMECHLYPLGWNSPLALELLVAGPCKACPRGLRPHFCKVRGWMSVCLLKDLRILTIWSWAPAFSTLMNSGEWFLIRRGRLGKERRPHQQPSPFQPGTPCVLGSLSLYPSSHSTFQMPSSLCHPLPLAACPLVLPLPHFSNPYPL